MNKSRREFLSNCLVGGFFTLFGLLIGKNFQERSKLDYSTVSNTLNPLEVKESKGFNVAASKEAILIDGNLRHLLGISQYTISTSVDVYPDPITKELKKGKTVTVGSMVITDYNIPIEYRQGKPFTLIIREKGYIHKLSKVIITQSTLGFASVETGESAIGIAFVAAKEEIIDQNEETFNRF